MNNKEPPKMEFKVAPIDTNDPEAVTRAFFGMSVAEFVNRFLDSGETNRPIKIT